MAKAVFLSSFGAQSLSNTTTLKQSRVVDSADTAIESLVQDVNGNLYDADGSSANTTRPGECSCEIKVSGTSDANFKTNTNALEALHGTKATLTGEYADATTVTCTARCYVEPVSVEIGTFTAPLIIYRLLFKKTTSWA